MDTYKNSMFSLLSWISRKLVFLPRGKMGVWLNKATGQYNSNPIVTFKANNGLHYIADLRSYTENYTPWTGEYEGATLSTILKLVPKDKHVLDIGGNVGYWSLNLAKAINNGSKVYTFEPVESNYNRIKEHITLNSLGAKITPFNVGLSDKDAKATIEINTKDKERNAQTFNARLEESDSGDFTLTTLDSIIDSEKINSIGFIKIDVEGFEIKALKGFAKLQQFRPIVYGEFTPSDIEKAGDNPQEIFDIFTDYTIFQEVEHGVFRRLNTRSYTRDILLVPNEQLSRVSPILYSS